MLRYCYCHFCFRFKLWVASINFLGDGMLHNCSFWVGVLSSFSLFVISVLQASSFLFPFCTLLTSAVDLQVARELSATKEELERKSQQLDTFEKERNEIDSLKTSLSQLQEKLDKELQTTKDLHTLNVKLKSQVKIGQDSLKAEMKRTDELMMQLKTRNGSASTPCLNVTNGSNGQATSTSSYSLNQSRD